MTNTVATAGEVFLVPLRADNLWSPVLVTHTDGKGTCVGRFFRISVLDPEVFDLGDLKKADAIATWMFGDFGIVNSIWLRVGALPGFDPSVFALPKFLRSDGDQGPYFVSTYSNDLKVLSEQKLSALDCSPDDFVPDRLMGSGSVEIKLTRLLT